MAIPKKNLLEAFQASAAAEKARVQSLEEATAAKAGGPFAPQPTSTPQRAPTRNSNGTRALTEWRPGVTQRLVALGVILLIAAFFLGRASVSVVDAQELEAELAQPEPARDSLAPTTARGASEPVAVQTSSDAGTAPERALLDPRNRYTVKLVEYRKGRDDALAGATLQWLLDQGLPAAAKFQGSQLFILLGAAENIRELDGLLERAKTMNGPPPLNKAAEFHDAYVAQIDRLLKR